MLPLPGFAGLQLKIAKHIVIVFMLCRIEAGGCKTHCADRAKVTEEVAARARQLRAEAGRGRSSAVKRLLREEAAEVGDTSAKRRLSLSEEVAQQRSSSPFHSFLHSCLLSLFTDSLTHPLMHGCFDWLVGWLAGWLVD